MLKRKSMQHLEQFLLDDGTLPRGIVRKGLSTDAFGDQITAAALDMQAAASGDSVTIQAVTGSFLMV